MSGKNMRIVALGGCGGMGQFAVRTAIAYDFVSEVVVADRDGQRARRFAEQCGPKAKSVSVDVMDSKALQDVLKDADVVLSTVGPYYRFGVPILRAAIEAGCHYFDINDDWEPTMEMLALDEPAKRAGIIAVIGMGASPGISNLLAVKAMNELDKVEELITGWGTGGLEVDEIDKPGEGGSYSAATEHWLHQLTGRIHVWRDGEYRDARPFEAITIDYPGIGEVTTHTVGHPEPVTLPLFRPEIRNSLNVMDMPPYINEPVRWLAGQVDRGRMTIAEANEQLIGVMDGELGLKTLVSSKLGRKMLRHYLVKSIRKKTFLPTTFAFATGTKDGKPCSVGVHLSGHPYGGMKRENMGAATGVPLAVTLALFARGRIDRRGVSTPEGAVDPDAFFDELAPLCTPAKENAKELVRIETSI